MYQHKKKFYAISKDEFHFGKEERENYKGQNFFCFYFAVQKKIIKCVFVCFVRLCEYCAQ